MEKRNIPVLIIALAVLIALSYSSYSGLRTPRVVTPRWLAVGKGEVVRVNKKEVIVDIKGKRYPVSTQSYILGDSLVVQYYTRGGDYHSPVYRVKL